MGAVSLLLVFFLLFACIVQPNNIDTNINSLNASTENSQDGESSSPSVVVFQQTTTIATASSTNHPSKLKVAICLTGQLLRLELLSKIRNFVVYNAMAKGHKMDLFVLLDNNMEEAHQTYWRYDYASESLYRNFTSKKLRMYIEKHIGEAVTRLGQLNHQHHFQQLKPPTTSMTVRVRLQPPAQTNFTAVKGIIPVDIKTGPFQGPRVEGDKEPAETRFQNNMRWMAGLRECTRWMQTTEHHQGWFYDLVVRLRDDSYVFGPWLLTSEKYKGAFVTAQIAANFGVNDHNFVVDREWADTVFRGITEDYYFNESLDNTHWINPEHRIYEVAKTKNVPFRFNDVCEMPLVPLRGKKSSTHWRIHSTYKQNLLDDCDPIRKKELEEESERIQKEIEEKEKEEKTKSTVRPTMSSTSNEGSTTTTGISNNNRKVISNRENGDNRGSSSSSSSSKSNSRKTKSIISNHHRSLSETEKLPELDGQSNHPTKFKQQPQQQSRERKYEVDSNLSLISRILWSGSSVFYWLIGSKDSDIMDKPTGSTAVLGATNIISSWTNSNSRKKEMTPTQEPTDRPTSSPIKLSTKMGKEGFKTCCSKLWVQMLENDEAKIFI